MSLTLCVCVCVCGGVGVVVCARPQDAEEGERVREAAGAPPKYDAEVRTAEYVWLISLSLYFCLYMYLCVGAHEDDL